MCDVSEPDLDEMEGATLFYNFDSEGNVAKQSDSGGLLLSGYVLDSHGTILSGT